MEDYNNIIVNVGSTSWKARKGGAAAVVREFVQHLSNTSEDYINLEVHTEEMQQYNNWYYAKVSDSLFQKNLKLLKALIKIFRKTRGSVYLVTHNIPVLLLSMIWIKFNPKVVHIHYFHGPAYLEAREEGAGQIHSYLIKLVELIFYSLTKRIVFLSKSFCTLFQRSYFRKSDSIIVPYSIANRPLPKLLSKPETSSVFRMLSVRRLQKRMGLDILIEAVSLINHDFELDIVGIGPEYDNLSALIKQYGLESKVRLCGRLSDAALNRLISNCDVTIMPTRSLEGFGISIIDSLVLGVPVIAFDVGGMPEILKRLQKSLIVDEFSPQALAQTLDSFIRGETVLPSPIECRAYVEEHYCDNYPRLLEWMYTF